MLITNPLWVTKTRLCLQYENSAKQYTGMVDCLRKIYKAEGIRGLYKVSLHIQFISILTLFRGLYRD